MNSDQENAETLDILGIIRIWMSIIKIFYHRGKIEIHHFEIQDDAGHEESPHNGKGEITSFTSIKDVEAAIIFQVDLEKFISLLSDKERNIFLKRLEGYNMVGIANNVKLDVTTVRR